VLPVVGRGISGPTRGSEEFPLAAISLLLRPKAVSLGRLAVAELGAAPQLEPQSGALIPLELALFVPLPIGREPLGESVNTL
jgi:hypothetical protein